MNLQRNTWFSKLVTSWSLEWQTTITRSTVESEVHPSASLESRAGINTETTRHHAESWHMSTGLMLEFWAYCLVVQSDLTLPGILMRHAFARPLMVGI